MASIPIPTRQPTPKAGLDRARAERERRVRARAYEIYLARHGTPVPGGATSDWLQAEREIAAQEHATIRGETLLSLPD